MKIKKTLFTKEIEITVDEIRESLYGLPPEHPLHMAIVNYLIKLLK